MFPLVARGDDKPKPKADADQRKCKNLIDDGRNLATANKLPAAIAKLEACIALIPDEPTALGELGFLAFRAKDLDKAERATRQAIASQAAPNLRGAVLYNLGLILEARKDTAGAIVAYSDSLRARPNGVVRAKLRGLNPRPWRRSIRTSRSRCKVRSNRSTRFASRFPRSTSRAAR